MIDLPAIALERGIDYATWNSLKNSIFPGAKDESIILAVDYCKARKLDVLKKPCHIVPMQVTVKTEDGKQHKEWRDVIMPGIYEQRTTAFKTKQMAGQDDPVFGPTITYMGVQVPEWCKVTVYRFTNGEKCAYTHTEYFSEACATKLDYNTQQRVLNSMWTKRPHGQLAKCAEAGALRKAFPDELGGVMTAEEMDNQSDDVIAHEPAHAVKAIALATEEQREEMRELIPKIGRTEEKVCKAYGQSSLDNLTEKEAEEALGYMRKAYKEKGSTAPEIGAEIDV